MRTCNSPEAVLRRNGHRGDGVRGPKGHRRAQSVPGIRRGSEHTRRRPRRLARTTLLGHVPHVTHLHSSQKRPYQAFSKRTTGLEPATFGLRSTPRDAEIPAVTAIRSDSVKLAGSYCSLRDTVGDIVRPIPNAERHDSGISVWHPERRAFRALEGSVRRRRHMLGLAAKQVPGRRCRAWRRAGRVDC